MLQHEGRFEGGRVRKAQKAELSLRCCLRTGTCVTFDDELKDCSKACKPCSLLSRRIKVSGLHVVAKRASAEPIEPPAPVINSVFPEMYSFNGEEAGTPREWPENCSQMLSSSCVSSTIAVTPDQDRGTSPNTVGERQFKSRLFDGKSSLHRPRDHGASRASENIQRWASGVEPLRGGFQT